MWTKTTDPAAAWHVVGVGRFSGRRFDELLWRNDDGSFGVWAGGSHAGLTPTVAADTWVPTSWSVSGTGDFNGDGYSDVLWRQNNGDMTDWLGQWDYTFVGNDYYAYSSVATNWRIAGTGDFNGDGHYDILWRNIDGRVGDWFGNANRGFTVNATLRDAGANWTVVGTDDFNRDGHTDILWRATDGTLGTWSADANGNFTPDTSVYVVGNEWTVVGTGDFNGDGRADIIWRRDDGAFTEWLGQTSGGFASNDSAAFAYMPTNAHVAAVGDFDGNGCSDILWRDGQTIWTWDGAYDDGGFGDSSISRPNGEILHLADGSPVSNYGGRIIAPSLPPEFPTVQAYLSHLADVQAAQSAVVYPAGEYVSVNFQWIPGAPGNGNNTNIIVNGGHWVSTSWHVPNYLPNPAQGIGVAYQPTAPNLYAMLTAGLGGTITTPAVPWWNRPKDAAIDVVARNIVDAIHSIPDHSTREYGAYIYQLPDGSIHASRIQGGTSTSLDPYLWKFDLPVNANIVGFVHTHVQSNLNDVADQMFLNTIGVFSTTDDRVMIDNKTDVHYTIDPMWRTYTETPNGIHEYDYIQNKDLYVPDLGFNAPTGNFVEGQTPFLGIEGEFIPDFHL